MHLSNLQKLFTLSSRHVSINVYICKNIICISWFAVNLKVTVFLVKM